MGMMTDILKERRVLTNVRLTDHQKAVLIRAFIAQSPRIATDNTTKNTSMVSARDTLQRIGLITYDGTNTEVTEQGKQLMKDESLIDDMNELTVDGKEVAFDDKDQPDGNTEQPEGTPTPTNGEDPLASGIEIGDKGGGAKGGGAANLGIARESFSLIKTLTQ